MIKFKPKFIGLIENPIIIVGEKPGRTRDNSTYSLQGNKTGDFIDEAIGNKTNIILTNIVNHFYHGKFDDQYVGEGVLDLMNLIETYTPRKIITLGEHAKKWTLSIVDIKCPIISMSHPSWINRFQSKYRHEYIKFLANELIK